MVGVRSICEHKPREGKRQEVIIPTSNGYEAAFVLARPGRALFKASLNARV